MMTLLPYARYWLDMKAAATAPEPTSETIIYLVTKYHLTHQYFYFVSSLLFNYIDYFGVGF